MANLTLPAPQLVLDPPAGPAAIEKPVSISLSGLQTGSGDPVPADQVRAVGAFLFRGPLEAEELWDEGTRNWASPAPVDAAGLSAKKPLTLAQDPGAASWTGTLVAAGQKDAAGQPKFDKQTGGAPVYRLRAVATALCNGTEEQAVSPPSPDLSFVSLADTRRFDISLDPSDAASAERVRIALRNGALKPAGWIELRSAGGHEIEIANTDSSGSVLARITLSADGDIRLAPAGGRAIVIEGELHADEISYLPHAGGARRKL